MLKRSVIKKSQKSTTGSAEVRLTSERTIECVLSGDITGSIVRQSVRETEELVLALKAQDKKPLLFIDMSALTSQDSGARSEAKRLAMMGIDKIAIYGAGRTLATIGQYIAHISGMDVYTRFFKNKGRALRWLEVPRRTPFSRKRLVIVLLSVIVGLVGVAAFIGWVISNETLVALSPNLKAMNPVTSVNMVLLATALGLLAYQKKRPVGRRATVIKLLAGWLGLYGLVVLFGHITSIQTGIDTWLFTEKLGTLGAVKAQASEVTSLLFMAMSLLIFLALARLQKKWMTPLFRVVTLLSGLLLTGVLIGYGFGLSRLYGVLIIPVPLNTTIAFIIALATVVGTVYTAKLFPIAGRLLKLYWAGLSVCIVIVVLTGIVWRQTTTSIDRNSDQEASRVFEKTVATIDGRVGSYVDVLYGFRAFFESSDAVAQNEYVTYFNGSGVQQNYPGFNALSFIRYVRPEEKAQFQASVRQQAATFPAYANFTVAPGVGNQYILTYIAPVGAATTFGADVGQLSGRKTTFDWARDHGKPRASGTVAFTTDAQKGFLITMPIYKAGSRAETVLERRQDIYGFVNAVFRNEVLFKDIFSSLELEDGVAFRVVDSDGNTIHQSSTMGDVEDFDHPRLTQTINVEGQQWTVAMQTTPEFGQPAAVGISRWLVLGSGLLLAFLAGVLMVSLSRRREHALELASSMTEDLNNERNAAEAVRQKDEAILASIGDAVFAVDRDQRITLFNPAAAALSGYDQSEALGRPYDEILPFVAEKTGASDKRFVERALKGTPGAMKADTLLRRKDGSKIAVADSAAPIHDSDGALIGAIIVFRDVSKERALDQAKSEFVSLASHQLRTPLSAINWYSEMLLAGDAGPLNVEQLEYMSEIFEGNQRMVELVDSLLNVSRLEVGKLKNEPKETSLTELADSLEKEMQTSIVTKHMNIKRDIQTKLPTVFADPKLLRMVIQNLLSNAVKYTPEKGTVTLVIRRATTNDLTGAKLRTNQEYVFISVTDTGYGIPKEQQPKIFEKLFRADNVRKLDVEGTGLGLYIVREVARKLGGAVWFESVEGKGTTFYVIIPVRTRPS